MAPKQYLRVYGSRWFDAFFKCRKNHHFMDTCYKQAFCCTYKIQDI